MANFKNMCIDECSKIQDAIKKLNENAIKTLFVVDNNFKLKGSITDGDIRRSLIKKFSMETKVTSFMNPSPKYCLLSDNELKIKATMGKNSVETLPILNENLEICGIRVNNENDDLLINKTPVIIMAGGFGKRLGELTKNTPKPMLKVEGKPILEHIILQLFQHGFGNIYISTHFLSEKIINYFQDGKKWGVNIKYLKEEVPLGTAGCLSLLEEYDPKQPVIITNGDLLTSINYADLLNYHCEEKNISTICVNNFKVQIPYGVINFKRSFLDSIIEKPTYNHTVLSGIYVFQYELIQSITKNTYLNMPDFINLINTKNNIGIFPIHEFWIDIGKRSDFQKAKSKNLNLY